MVSVSQIKAARSLLGWSQNQLAEHSGVSIPTVKRVEAGSPHGEMGGRSDTSRKLVVALETAGIIFIDENGEGPGVRLKKGTLGDRA